MGWNFGLDNAHWVVHSLIVLARLKAYEHKEHQGIAELLDCAEYLVTRIATRDDMTDIFRDYIEDVTREGPALSGLLDGFEHSSYPEHWC